MKVTKFGGSSLASAEQLQKVLDIVKSDKERRFIVVSAPGKRYADDTKVTDALINYYNHYIHQEDTSSDKSWIIQRYQDIASDLNLDLAIIDTIKHSIEKLETLPIENNPYLYDTFLAAGEDNNAKLIASFFTENGLDAVYLHPRDAGLIVSSEPQNARLLPSSYEHIQKITQDKHIYIIPGFFGVTLDNNVCTFSRGGSDITGSLIAAGTKADLYENFTDVDGIFAAHPGVVHKPHSISELTYKEMRELAYAGFSVLHDEALIPAYRAKIPLVIKNTNNPSHPGTKVSLKHESLDLPVVGISGDDHFVSINISKYLMNREIGFGRKVLQLLEELNMRWEHIPTGIDDMSVVLRERELTPEKEAKITSYLREELQVDDLEIEKALSIIMIVGENMKNHIGITASATKALSDKKINLEMISQGSSEVSIMFVIKSKQEKEAIQALYSEFFPQQS